MQEQKPQSIESIIKPIISISKEKIIETTNAKNEAEFELAIKKKKEALENWKKHTPLRYVSDLEKIENGVIEELDWFSSFKQKWASKKQGDFAIIFGRTGIGKSVVGAWVCREAWLSGQDARFLEAYDLPVLINQRESGFSKTLFEFRNCDVLVIDDLGGMLQCPWRVWNELDAIIKHRFARYKSTYIASTATKRQLIQKFGPEFMDRFPKYLQFGIDKERSQRQ